MNLEQAYLAVRKQVWLSRVVMLLRFLIGFAFVPSGMKKLLGLRFTQLPTDSPIGFFFEGLYRSGVYWQFLGLGQVLAALLLMTQRFATLGALIFSFIAVNIWVITLSLHFSGTWVITSGLLVAVGCLLLWDWNKLRFLFAKDNFSADLRYEGLPTHSRAWEIAGLLLFLLSTALSWKLGVNNQ